MQSILEAARKEREAIGRSTDRVARSIEEQRIRYGISRATFYRLVAAKQIKVVKMGRRSLVSDAEMHRWFSTLNHAA